MAAPIKPLQPKVATPPSSADLSEEITDLVNHTVGVAAAAGIEKLQYGFVSFGTDSLAIHITDWSGEECSATGVRAEKDVSPDELLSKLEL